MANLNKDIFGLKVENHELVKLCYDAYLANSRSSHAKTLKRGEVRDKKVLVVLVLVRLVTQFGDMVAWRLVVLATKTLPKKLRSLRNY